MKGPRATLLVASAGYVDLVTIWKLVAYKYRPFPGATEKADG